MLAPVGLELLGEVNTDNMEVVKIKWLYIANSFLSAISAKVIAEQKTVGEFLVTDVEICTSHNVDVLNSIEEKYMPLPGPEKLRNCGQTRKLGLRDGLLWHR